MLSIEGGCMFFQCVNCNEEHFIKERGLSIKELLPEGRLRTNIVCDKCKWENVIIFTYPVVVTAIPPKTPSELEVL